MSSQEIDECRCCRADARFVLAGEVIGIPVKYFECEHCGFVQTEKPHWLELAYSDAITHSDTGLVSRNLINARYTLATLRTLGMPKGKVLDFAGGYGLLVRLLRDKGVNALWSDPFCENLHSKGFEHTGESVDLTTAFEVFEHLAEPEEEFDKMLDSGRNILLSTVLIPRPAPAHDSWWYYGHGHGQHVAFYRVSTLEAMAKRHNLHVISNGRNYHLFTDKKVNKQHWRVWLKMGKANAPWLYRGLKSLTKSDSLHQIQTAANARTPSEPVT
ncbi:MAG: class I SAM-dependent methyltransferase [Granulosicoccus sp.]